MPTTISGTDGVDKVKDGTVVQADLASGLAGTGPAFSAWANAGTSLPTATATKIAFQTEEFDTAAAYDTTTSRFQPAVPGYYLVSATLMNPNTTAIIYVFKNGAEFKRGTQTIGAPLNQVTVTVLMYLNGTTDYVEIFGYQASGSTQSTGPGQNLSYFQGCLVRAA